MMPLHKNRVWAEPVRIDDPAVLAEKFANHSWCNCAAWQMGPYLLLNDQTCEDGAFEVSVIKDDRQIESITFGWMRPDGVERTLKSILAGEYDEGGLCREPVKLKPFHSRGEYCAHCA